ncbi:MAG: choice-of-anchor R domain-containing protein [Thermoplasmata archaeon]
MPGLVHAEKVAEMIKRIRSRAGRRTVVILVLFHILFILSIGSSSGQEVIFDHNEIWGGTYYVVSKTSAVAQSFTASDRYTLTKISLHVKTDRDSDLNVTIQTSNFGLPSGTEIGYFNAGTSPPFITHDWMDFFAANQIDIEEDTTYWIVAKCSEAPPNGYYWYSSDSDAYDYGMMAEDDSGIGEAWSLNSADDQMFRVWGTPLSSTLYFDLLVDKEVVEPGETLQYTVFFNNTGNAESAKVWINDTLPSGLEYLSDTASDLPFFSGGYMDGQSLHFNFTNVPPGSHSFALKVAVNESLPVGTDVTNWAYMDYTDSVGFYLSSLGDGVSSRVVYREPHIIVEAVVDYKDVESGGMVTYTIYFNNTGTGIASTVWINDTIPEHMSFLASNPPPSWNDDREYRFTFSDVPPGSHSLSLAAIIDDELPNDTVFVNSVVLNHTNSRNMPMQGSYDITIMTMAGDPGGANDFPISPSLLVSIVLVMGSVSAGATFVVMNRRKPAIDEVFFLHRSGELIKHYTTRIKPDVDSDILSGMLVAVQDFVGDTFKFKKGELNRLKFGEYQIAIIRCEHIVLAGVTSGPEPRKLESQLRDACKEIEKRFGKVLKNWSGILDELEGADDIIKRLIMDKY